MIQGLYNGLSGLISYQKALDVTSNNVANANNKDYSKQVVNFKTNPSKEINNIKIGTGVTVDSVDRVHDKYLFNNLKNSIENNEQTKEEFNNMENLNNLLNENNIIDNETMSSLTDKLFENITELSINLDDESIKESIKSSFDNLNNRYDYLNSIFQNEYKELNERKDLYLKESKTLISELEEVNLKINQIEPLNIDNNELKDRKDTLEIKLSELGDYTSFDSFVSKTDNNNTDTIDLKTTGNFSFSEGKGKLAGINNSLKYIENLSQLFEESFTPLQNEINSFIENDFENPLNVLEFELNEKPTESINNIFLDLNNKKDNLGTHLGSTESIFNNLEKLNNEKVRVNTDEEMVNLIKYQRAYEANAKVITTIDEMLKTLLNMKQ